MNKLASVGIAAALACAACGGAPTTIEPSHAAFRDADGWLVWSRTHETPRTVWLDDDGHELDALDGEVVIATQDGLFRFVVESRHGALPACAELGLDRARAAPGEASQVIAQFVELGGSRTVLARTAASLPEVTSLEQTVTLEGSVGALVAVREQVAFYGCGAHPSHNVNEGLLDLERGVVSRMPPADLDLKDAAARALREADADHVYDDSLGGTQLTLNAIVPRWDGGRLVAAYLFTAGAPYAASDGLWSSDTRSVFVEGPLPEAFSAEPQVPEGVARWIAEHPGVRGVSRARAALHARFVRQERLGFRRAA